MKSVEININQKPISVTFECPHCYWDNYIDYGDFTGMVSDEYCDWKGSKLECELCKERIEIDSIEWG